MGKAVQAVAYADLAYWTIRAEQLANSVFKRPGWGVETAAARVKREAEHDLLQAILTLPEGERNQVSQVVPGIVRNLCRELRAARAEQLLGGTLMSGPTTKQQQRVGLMLDADLPYGMPADPNKSWVTNPRLTDNPPTPTPPPVGVGVGNTDTPAASVMSL